MGYDNEYDNEKFVREKDKKKYFYREKYDAVVGIIKFLILIIFSFFLVTIKFWQMLETWTSWIISIKLFHLKYFFFLFSLNHAHEFCIRLLLTYHSDWYTYPHAYSSIYRST